MSDTVHRSAFLALIAASEKIRNRPGLDELKQARDMAKSAYQTLDSAYTLAAKGILRIVDETEDEPAPLFRDEGGEEGGEETPDPKTAQEAPGTPGEVPTDQTPAPEPVDAPQALPALSMAPRDEGDVIDAEVVETPGEEVQAGSEPEGSAAIHPDEALKEDARRTGTEERWLSTKLLRNKLGWGYDKARRILDALIAEGFCTESGEVNE